MSNPAATPSWAQPTAGTTGPAAPPPAAYVSTPPTPPAPQPNSTTSLEPSAKKANLVQRLLSIVNLGLCASMVAAALYTLFEVEDFSNTDELSEIFVSLYMIMFSALLSAYEFMWWFPIPVVNKSIRKNFGFLYGIKGKAAFIIFVAILNFGMDPEGLNADMGDTGFSVEDFMEVLGFCMLGVGIVHLLVWFKYHKQFENYQAPTAGLTPTSDEATGTV